MPAYPNVVVQLSNENGNVFSIIRRVTKAMRNEGLREEAEAFAQEAMSSRSYDAVLKLVMRTVDTR